MKKQDNKVKPLYDLTTNTNVINYKKNLSSLHADFHCSFNTKDLTVSAAYKGVDLEAIKLFNLNKNDTFILIRKKHRNMKIKDLLIIGAIYHVDHSLNGLDYITFHIDPAQSSITVQTIIDTVDSSDRVKHNKLLNYLARQKTVKILDDGRTNKSDYETLKASIKNKNYPIKVSVLQYGPIWIALNVGNPNTVGELIQIVDDFRKQVYNSI